VSVDFVSIISKENAVSLLESDALLLDAGGMIHRAIVCMIIGLISVCLSNFALAEVVRQEPDYFQVQSVVEVPHDLDTVFAKFERIQGWWNPDHTFGGDITHFRFDKNQQALVETLEDGFVRHLDIVFWKPKSRVVLRGGLGPLLTEVVNGILIFDFKEEEGVTTLAMKYSVSGKVAQGKLGDWASAVDYVLSEQVQRLVKSLESQP